jgi:hypothetical protein
MQEVEPNDAETGGSTNRKVVDPITLARLIDEAREE